MVLDEEDDDDAFGDFKFVSSSFPSSVSPAPNSLKPPDDEWGDFVESSLQFIHPPAAAPFDPFPALFDSLSAADPSFDAFGNHGSSGSAAAESGAGARKAWEKPLPLSIFGEENVEEESIPADLLFGDPDVFAPKPLAEKGLAWSSAAMGGSSFTDLLANLYGNPPPVEVKEGEVKVGYLSVENAIDENGWEFKEAGPVTGAHNGGFQEKEQKIANGAETLPNGEIKDRQAKVENCVTRELIEEDNEIDDNDWEFKDSSMEIISGGDLQDTKECENSLTRNVQLTTLTNGEMEFDMFHVQNESLSQPSKLTTLTHGDMEFDLFDVQNESLSQPSTYVKKDLSGSSLAFDLMSSLYSEDKPESFINGTKVSSDIYFRNRTEVSSVKRFDFLHSNSISNVNGDGNNLNARISDLKGALEDMRVEEPVTKSRTSSPPNPICNLNSKKFNDFYCRLKEESRALALYHLEDLKRKKVAAALSGKDDEVTAMNEKIQFAHKKLQQENGVSGKVHPVELPPGAGNVDKLLELVQAPDLQVLEFEYHLENQISLAKENLGSSIGLFEHANSVLHILSLASADEQISYIDAWSKMVLACSLELQHGSMIWKQSLQNNIQAQILMNPQGQQYFVALGEIYRVTEVLRSSAILYKPWILLNNEVSADIYTSLKECRSLWLDSGLRDALEDISDSSGHECDVSIRALLESIKYICDLDEVSLQKQMLSHDGPLCRLSLLSINLLPEMKVVFWEGEQYFLTLANFWANKISCSPPYLLHIHVG